MTDEVVNDDIELKVDGEVADDATVAVEPVEEDWKSQFEAAKKRADEAEAAKAEAEKLAQQRASEIERYSRENTEARSKAVSAEMTAIDNALANVEHERADAKAKYRAAMEAGDFDAAAEAQDMLATTAIKSQRIKEGKAALERRAEDAKTMADPVEQWASRVSPRAGAWIRSHPDSVRTVEAQQKLEKAHYLALGNGHQADTDGYFAFLESQLSPKAEASGETTSTRTQSVPAAPVSREGSAAAPQARTTTIRLTAAQREIAAACGMTDAEYAKQLIAIQRDANGATTH